MGNQQPTGNIHRSKSDYFATVNGHNNGEAQLPRRISSAASSANLLDRFQQKFNSKRRGSSTEALCKGSSDNIKSTGKVMVQSKLAAPRLSLTVSPIPPPTAMPIKTILKKERSFNTSNSELNEHHQVYRSTHSVSFDNGSLHESPYGSPSTKLLTIPTTTVITADGEELRSAPSFRKSSIQAGLHVPTMPVHSHSWNNIVDAIQPYEDEDGHCGIAENLRQVNLALANLTVQCDDDDQLILKKDSLQVQMSDSIDGSSSQSRSPSENHNDSIDSNQYDPEDNFIGSASASVGLRRKPSALSEGSAYRPNSNSFQRKKSCSNASVKFQEFSTDPLDTLDEIDHQSQSLIVSGERRKSHQFTSSNSVDSTSFRRTNSQKARQRANSVRKILSTSLLTLPQITMVRNIWNQLITTKGPTVVGTMLIQRVFFKEPMVKEVFKRVKLGSNSNFDEMLKSHSRTMTDTLDMVVQNLEQLESMGPALIELGKAHGPLYDYGLKPNFWDVFSESFVDCTLQWGEKSRRTEEVRLAWVVLITFVVERLKAGFQEGRKRPKLTRGIASADKDKEYYLA